MDRRPLRSPTFERQEDEGPEAWEAFRTYRDLGPGRTLDAARQKLGRESGYLRQVEEWSSLWSWVRRTVDYDRHLDAIRRAAQEAEVVKMAERQARDAMNIQAGLRPLIEALAAKAAAAGHDLSDYTAPGLAMLIKEVMPAFKSAAELERLARGVETEHVHVSGVVVDDLRSAYAERLRRRQKAHEGRDAPGGEGALLQAPEPAIQVPA